MPSAAAWTVTATCRCRRTPERAVELRDDQPMTHEIGNRTYIVADVEPLDVDGVRTVAGRHRAVAGRRSWRCCRSTAASRTPGTLVALDLPGRLRARPVRPGVLPAPQARTHGAARGRGRLGAESEALRTVSSSSRRACRATGSGSGCGSCCLASCTSECAPQPWSKETTRPSSLASPLAHTPNVSDSGPAIRTRKPQVEHGSGADWASGEPRAAVAVVPPLGGELAALERERPDAAEAELVGDAAGSAPRRRRRAGRRRRSTSAPAAGRRRSTGSRSPGERSPGWIRSR